MDQDVNGIAEYTGYYDNNNIDGVLNILKILGDAILEHSTVKNVC